MRYKILDARNNYGEKPSKEFLADFVSHALRTGSHDSYPHSARPRSLEEKVDVLLDKFGELVEHLHAKGTLDKAEVLGLADVSSYQHDRLRIAPMQEDENIWDSEAF